MALPDKLADLFGQSNSPKLPAVKGLQQLSYKISWDPLDDGTAPPELKSQLAGLYEAVRNRPNRRQVEQLQNLVQQYPNVPILKNYLMLAYELTGQKSRARELLDQTVKQHPRYLMGLANKAHQYLQQDDTEGVEALFGGPPTDISLFYPDRSEFHVSEVANFTHVAFAYDLAKNKPDAAETRLRLLTELGYHSKEQLRSLKQELDFARMRYNLDQLQEGLANAINIEGSFRAGDKQTNEPPIFQHPEIQWLYQYGYTIPADKIATLLALPRPSLTADLSKVLLDTIYRYEHFQEEDWDEKRHNFASHALLLATELQADECLEAVLETLRQGGDFRDFWWGDYTDDFYVPYFRQLLPQQADALKAFMLEPDVNTYSKSTISNAWEQAVQDYPEWKSLAQTWYADVFAYFLNHADDEDLLDADLIAFMISDVTTLHLTELMPLIRTAYARNLVTLNIQGDLADVEREMIKRSLPPDHRPLRSILEQYDYLRDPSAWHKAHPNPELEAWREERKENLINNPKESEWDFLDDEDDDTPPNGALFPSQRSSYPMPRQVQPTPGRNDKVSVRYTDGKVVKDVKYKKVEADVQAGKCVLM
ncbi:tetratricopeptide repeat protein [Spirosoma litoris]